MKFECSKSNYEGSVSSCVEVVLSLAEGEAKKLREALATVHACQKAAFEGVMSQNACNPTESDWHMVSYAVKNDKVIVTIKDGMTG